METKPTKEHLIDIGVALMHRNGYGATGLNDILNAASVPKGSFYHHFGSKEEFASAVLQEYGLREMQHWLGLQAKSKQSPLKRLRRYFEELIVLYGQKGPIPGCLIGLLSLEVSSHSQLIQKTLSELFHAWQKGIEETLEEAIELKELPASDKPSELASFLLNSWQGALLRSLAEKSDAPLHNFLQFAFDRMLATKARAR